MDMLSRIALIYFVAAMVCAVIVTMAAGPKWFLGLKRWVTLAVAASMLAAAGVGIYGYAARAERAELTFDPATDVVWRSVPIRVFVMPGDGYSEATDAAVRIWNHSVGCELFALEATGNAAQVRVRGFDGLPCGKAFRDLHGSEAQDRPEGTWDCKDGTNEILLNNPGDIDTAFRSVVHGLGHVVRLAHDESGVMAPVIQPLNIVAPNRKDIAALRARYCH